MTIKYLKPKRSEHLGEAWRPCRLCGSAWSETDTDTGYVNEYGTLYPESLMVERDGFWYCQPHYRFKFYKKDLDEAEIDISEADRQGPEKGHGE